MLARQALVAGPRWLPTCRRALSTTPAPGVLLRDYLFRGLYAPGAGYFEQHATILQTSPAGEAEHPAPVASGRAPPSGQRLAFDQLAGETEYKQAVARLYTGAIGSADQPGDSPQVWHTPVEIFSPWYGRALGRYLLSQHGRRLSRHGEHPLSVTELGGGNGTLMLDILDYIQAEAPSVYQTMQYSLYDVSSRMHALQRAALAGSAHAPLLDRRPGPAAGSVQLHHRSALDIDPSPDLGFVISAEMLDNLPHDRVVWSARAPTKPFEIHVAPGPEPNGLPHALARPAADPWVIQYLTLHMEYRRFLDTMAAHQDASIWARVKSWVGSVTGGMAASTVAGPSLSPMGADHLPVSNMLGDIMYGLYAPTVCLQLMDRLARARPRQSLLFTDFSALPDAVSSEPLAPVVQSVLRPDQFPGFRLYPGITDSLYAPSVTDCQSAMAAETRALKTYLLPPDLLRQCDVFFPTDFQWLVWLDARLRRRHHPELFGPEEGTGAGSHAAGTGRALSHGDFFRAFGSPTGTRTRSGFDPLVDDYFNVGFLLTGTLDADAP
ncbi:hypothetical protein H696_04369 [Fonticula alba]|uniref:Protein arginine methyltransferase NDUFAF7 n=1 Tax=Fonticula alba TaxID=691883 RepID=A0A058Z3X3_FONAL|nr:hypothetical protein H696_04369 [Fonticula alba]KCV68950.1 hypothetical protein H696_04369 [Fonticula alba]|eukprot:XP_009496521.1 hypothetical protein H696_04369 [Fonticula alba]